MAGSVKKIALLLLILSSVITSSIAQNKATDKLVMINGDEFNGQVTEIGDESLKFVHTGESLTYTIKKKDINKIQFASGRVEIITVVPHDSSGTPAVNTLRDHHNKVAILPFSYIGLGGARDEKMSKKVQSDCYNILKKSTEQFFIQDPITTNAILIKNNLNSENIAGLLPAEIAELLGVEYIFIGTVSINQKGSTSTSGAYGSNKTTGNKTAGYVLGASSTSVEYQTNVDLSIYNDQGTNVFSNSHVSFWQTEDAYTATLQYLIKRTPLYSK